MGGSNKMGFMTDNTIIPLYLQSEVNIFGWAKDEYKNWAALIRKRIRAAFFRHNSSKSFLGTSISTKYIGKAVKDCHVKRG